MSAKPPANAHEAPPHMLADAALEMCRIGFGVYDPARKTPEQRAKELMVLNLIAQSGFGGFSGLRRPRL
jgi:hypothetical protein